MSPNLRVVKTKFYFDQIHKNIQYKILTFRKPHNGFSGNGTNRIIDFISNKFHLCFGRLVKYYIQIKCRK